MRTRKQTRAEEEHAAEAISASPTSATSPTVASTKIEAPTSSPSTKHNDTQSSAGRRSKLPTPVQFPLVAILSLSLSALGHSLAWPYTKGALGAYSRVLETWTEVGLVTGWKLFELALGWFGDYDGYDITALNFLSHGPFLYLLFAFYQIQPAALVLTIAIETLATYIPFRLLRPLSTAHADPHAAPNADIVTDRPIAVLTALLAGAIYSVALLLAYAIYLPQYLVVYFADLPSVAAAHETTYVNLLPVALALGFAARAFVFTPAEATERPNAEPFDPVVATLAETIRWNFWGWSAPAKVVILRTALLALVTGANTFLQTRFTLEGVETPGALAWTSVWVFAATATGLGLGAVGSG
ncbi:hypothetical protein GGS23DRAFT_324906 [Durotheca rogersii]|uniref:uncharacterized protein n=1 Tax=Durotheca rogersii TaxID=419775 RepID=UPI0022207C99|nr:uncharacterized protein GGS23DRAFT_324906 [Durotheca rogersii]KAI5859382.1 hypothetical protein GGS23DRAFT_324906 [Durotheca rogersii]